jgi:hypothetical protein
MPLSSTEIAAMNGSFQSQAMSNLSYASAIGQGGGGVYGGGYRGAGTGGDRMMGGAMGTAAAVGAPLMSGAMGLLGLDPMSMGLKAGMSAFGSGAGLGGAALAGGAVALPLMAAGAAVSYAGGQMFEGASQQSNLNAQLRSSFNFSNRQGGQGFSRSDMTSIGSAVREMSEQFGPGGEVASFRELSGLAGKMGSMGFAQGVKDVKDFTSRFKEMVKSLKTMATDLGTTLEGAMEFAQAAKSSGVFGANRAVGFTAAARQATVSGGLALSEGTGAASIGSQIARSVGGLGRQGAMAGIRTIGQIGTAQQMGVISEEDIYNSTGQTGAEGRQAFAASSMASSAKFLQSGRGRRMLASMAGKNGTLDEDSVQQILSGGMSISETMRQDKAHVTGAGAPVNRANFIRNEGRLRGAAMERLGGFLPALQLQEWAASKGVDINEMDDRSMLFAQRQLGMGRDEVDNAVKMANAMPQILERERRSGQQDQYFQALSTARKGQGIEGVKQKFEQAKELINGKLQKAGQDIFNAGSEAVDTFFNKLFGTYVETYSKDIDDSYRSMLSGGSQGRAAGTRAFGLGGGAALNKAARGALTPGGVGGVGTKDLATAMNTGGLFQKTGIEQMRAAGFELKGKNSQEIQSKLQSIQAAQMAAATGFDKEALAAGSQGGKADFIQAAYAMGKVEGDGDVRVKNLTSLINEQAKGPASDPNTQAALAMPKQLRGKSDAEKVGLLANYERAQGIAGKAGLAARYGLPEGGMMSVLAQQGTAGFGSMGEENTAFAKALGFGRKGSVKEGLIEGGIHAGLNLLGLGVGSLLSAAGGDMIHNLVGKFTGSGEREQAAGRFIKGEQFRDISAGLLSNDEDTSAAAMKALQKELGDQVGEMTPETEVKRDMMKAAQFAAFASVGNPTPAQQEAKAKELGVPLDKLKATLGGMANVLDARQRKDLAEQGRRLQVSSAKERDQLSMHGIIDANGQLSGAKTKELTALGGAALEYARLSVGITEQEGRFTGTGSDADRGVLGGIMNDAAKRGDILEHMTVEQKRKAARAMAGSEGAAELSRSAAEQQKFMTMSKRYGGNGAVARSLGITMSPEELKNLNLSNPDDVKSLLSKAGLPAGKENVDALSGARGAGSIGEVLRRIKESAAGQEAEKKRSEAFESSPEGKLAGEMKKNSDKANQFLEAIAKAQGVATATLQAIKDNNTDNPENKK